jgi:type III restriction enzyme
MNPHVNAISNRLSLRKPQKDSLEILSQLCEILPLKKGEDAAEALRSVQNLFPHVQDFERDFPSLCFALATGVGKTRLMGAFIAYLHKTEGIRHFFVLAPNLTIYNKLIADFTPNTPKYVFQGLSEFAIEPPEIITGDNYESGRGVRQVDREGQRRFDFAEGGQVHINIFNISKINSEVRGGKEPRIKRLHEYIGQSYFDYLSQLDDLVLIMDESHRYRAEAGMRAIGELNPILGLELTATPQLERGGSPVPFQNVIYNYPLANAMQDGFVKEPAVATRENFIAKNYDLAGLELLKLEDGIRLHENTKLELEIYARNNERPIVKPFMLIVARDTEHADSLMKQIEDSAFFSGRYRGKVIQVHSKQSGEEKDETIEQLMNVEKPDNPTEIVIHVNMLKEGWDVTNLYTIVPLRAANSKTLVEQSIGRGLRLPYGKRTGVDVVDRLTIVSHDRFQEIVDYANSPESPFQMQTVIITNERSKIVFVEPEFLAQIQPSATSSDQGSTSPNALFVTPGEQEAAKATMDIIRQYESLPHKQELKREEIRNQIVDLVRERIHETQPLLSGLQQEIDVERVVAQTINLFIDLTIDIPRITLQPVGEVSRGFSSFTLDLQNVQLRPVEHDILIKELQKQQLFHLCSGDGIIREKRPEDYLIRGLIDFDDINYDSHASLLYDLAGQVVAHLRCYLGSQEDLHNVLMYHQRGLVQLIHSQMQTHYEEKATAFEAHVSKGFMILASNNYKAPLEENERDYRIPVSDKQNIRNMIFAGFLKCLFRIQKFDSDSERRFAVVLENDSTVEKWFKPARKVLPILYEGDKPYEPDFVVETKTEKLLCETKAKNEMDDPVVLAKATAAREWCRHATNHAQKYGGKPWRYLLVSHDRIFDYMTLKGLS